MEGSNFATQNRLICKDTGKKLINTKPKNLKWISSHDLGAMLYLYRKVLILPTFLAGSFTIDLLTSSRTGEINLRDSTIMHILRYRDL